MFEEIVTLMRKLFHWNCEIYKTLSRFFFVIIVDAEVVLLCQRTKSFFLWSSTPSMGSRVKLPDLLFIWLFFSSNQTWNSTCCLYWLQRLNELSFTWWWHCSCPDRRHLIVDQFVRKDPVFLAENNFFGNEWNGSRCSSVIGFSTGLLSVEKLSLMTWNSELQFQSVTICGK